MAMHDGVKQWVGAAVDMMNETTQGLIDHGLDPKQAVMAAAFITKEAAFARIDEHFENQNASEITHGLSKGTGISLQ